jgi:hypothetical protein
MSLTRVLLLGRASRAIAPPCLQTAGIQECGREKVDVNTWKVSGYGLTDPIDWLVVPTKFGIRNTAVGPTTLGSNMSNGNEARGELHKEISVLHGEL